MRVEYGICRGGVKPQVRTQSLLRLIHGFGQHFVIFKCLPVVTWHATRPSLTVHKLVVPQEYCRKLLLLKPHTTISREAVSEGNKAASLLRVLRLPGELDH